MLRDISFAKCLIDSHCHTLREGREKGVQGGKKEGKTKKKKKKSLSSPVVCVRNKASQRAALPQ